MINLQRLPKQEILWLSKHKCKAHSHTFLEHPNCVDIEKPSKSLVERVGFLDIEAEDLKADYGVLFSYYIKVANENKYYFDYLKTEDFKKYSFKGSGEAKEDTRLLKSLVNDLQNFDRVIGHYSSRYDLQFIRTRAVICKVDFPEWGTLWQTDTWNILKHKFKLSRNSLQNGTLKLTGATNKTYLSLNLKHAMIRGEKWAIDYLLDHNKKDVIDTERLYNAISKYARETKSSI